MKITKWPFSWYGKKKAFLAFEFAMVLAESAAQLKVPITKELVEKAEKLIENELGSKSAKNFALHMNMYVLAILEPKD